MLKAELQYLKQHRFMMLVVTVLFFLPALYAIPFLGSLWNTYGNVDKLPVAVVNHDQTTQYHKQKIDVGAQLVRTLKQSDALDFAFTNQKQAQQGLNSGQYYMVVTIPKDFSKDATTLLDDRPKQMQIDYQTSSGHSFIAGKLSESAAEKLRQQVSKTVTRAYAKAMFTEFKQAENAFGKAADGNQKLAHGSEKIKAGNEKLHDGLTKLAKSTLNFGSGTQTLHVALKEYVAGIGQANQGNEAVGTGLQQMQGQLPALSAGVDNLNQGQNNLTRGLGQTDNGQRQLNSGLGTAVEGQRRLNAGLSTTMSGQKKLNQGLNQYTKGVLTLADNSQKLAQGMAKLKKSADQGGLDSAKLNQAKADIKQMQNLLNQAQGQKFNVDAVQQDLQRIATAADALQKPTTKPLDQTNAAIDQAAKAQKLTPEQTAAMKQAVQSAQTTDQSMPKQQLVELQQSVASLNQQIAPMAEVLNNQQSDLARLEKHAQNLPEILDSAETKVKQLQALPSALSQLQTGADALWTGADKLNQKSQTLTVGSQKLLDSNEQLLMGSQKLVDGNASALAGSQKLVAANEQALSGSQRLSNGTKTMANKVPALQQGVNQLVAGNGQVQNGLQTLQNKGSDLVNGAGQLATGSQALHAGSNQLLAGNQQIGPALSEVQKGNQTLADKLDQATHKLSDVPNNQANYQQMAQPTKIRHYEKDHVPNNGTGMAPYMFSVGLFVGMLGINLMIDLVEPRTSIRAIWRWVGSKLVILFGIATMMALVLFALSKWILGMHFVDAMGTLRFLILMAWMDAALVTAINLWFGRAGSFISVVLLVAQLSLSAGTYPIQLSPEIYQKLHDWVPMTYTVDGLRQTMMIGGIPTQPIQMLVAITGVSLIAMIWYYLKHRKDHFVLGEV